MVDKAITVRLDTIGSPFWQVRRCFDACRQSHTGGCSWNRALNAGLLNRQVDLQHSTSTVRPLALSAIPGGGIGLASQAAATEAPSGALLLGCTDRPHLRVVPADLPGKPIPADYLGDQRTDW